MKMKYILIEAGMVVRRIVRATSGVFISVNMDFQQVYTDIRT